MTAYAPPLAEMNFVLNHVIDLKAISELPKVEGADPETAKSVLEEAGKLAAEVLAPLNRVGDQTPSRLENGVVRTPPGFKEAYKQYVDGGWNALPFEAPHGGQDMPWSIAMAVQEMWNSANMGFALCPLLNQGAVEALSTHGSTVLQDTYLARMISGAWTGTMNLTEPQAGSDVGALKTRAVPAPDGSWRITGTKIFITYGDHDFTDNIVHLVLARTPDAPPGTRGISLFLVPKFLPNPDGSPGKPNDLRCVSLEHKLGIHASPTCVMSFGDNGGATGWMIGQINQGMRCMFTMMNTARQSVGVQGLAIAERAYQQAVAFAKERKQGRAVGRPASESAAIIEHADVRRMLMTMKAEIEAMRALIYLNAESLDLAKRHPDVKVREARQGMVELLTPVVKGWCTDLGCEIASLGVQVHGGMGFIEETGAAQHMRDARIAPIYEGTNGIQAMDLVGRKLTLQGGVPLKALFAEMRATATQLDGELAPLRPSLDAGIEALEGTSRWIAERVASDADAVGAAASPYLRQFGTVAGGWLLARSAIAARRLLSAGGADAGFLKAKIATARYYAEQILPQAPALTGPITAGAATLFAVAPELLSA
jgi:alkylation response protein AidB-like acyl-CoA dehydrogenase